MRATLWQRRNEPDDHPPPRRHDAAVLGCLLIGLLAVLPALVGLGLALLSLYGVVLRPVAEWLLRLAGLG